MILGTFFLECWIYPFFDKDSPSLFCFGICSPANRLYLFADRLSADLQVLRSFQLSASFAHKFSDAKLLLGKLGTVEGQQVSDAIHHLIGLTEPKKNPTQGSFPPCVFYCRPRVIERGSVDIYGLFLDGCSQDPESDTHSQVAIGEPLVNVPHQVGNRCC